MSSVKGACVCESRRTELLCQQSSFFHVLTATYVKLLPVAWVLDFGSSRAWLGIDRLASHSSYLEWWGSNVLRSAWQRLDCILYRTTVAATRSFWWRDGMLKFAHASPEARPIIRSAFFSIRSSRWSVIVEGLIQHSEAYSMITLRIWALYTVALRRASSLNAMMCYNAVWMRYPARENEWLILVESQQIKVV